MAETRQPTPEELMWANMKAAEAEARLREDGGADINPEDYDRLVQAMRSGEAVPDMGPVEGVEPPPKDPNAVPDWELDRNSFPVSLLKPFLDLLLRNVDAERKQQEQVNPKPTNTI